MSANAIWLVIAGMAITNFVIRFPSLAVLSRARLPEWLRRWLSFIPVSAMATLVVAGVARPDGAWLGPTENPYLWAALGTGLVYWRTRSFLGATLGGVVMFLALRALLG
ncbi:MAG: AzlD domain-containing protein [Aeromicrobium sp.]|jgi:branched-subunit amino acid transport protein|nr:AzlD domain-containing protein [Aeromicrobium sp.]